MVLCVTSWFIVIEKAVVGVQSEQLKIWELILLLMNTTKENTCLGKENNYMR